VLGQSLGAEHADGLPWHHLISRHFRGGRSGHKKRDGSERVIEGIRQKAQLAETVTPHTFRHTVSTRLKELGVSEEIRADILDPGKTSITQAYSHTILRQMQQALCDLGHLRWERRLKQSNKQSMYHFLYHEPKKKAS
jgi:integrase